jgi:hypothetical protein
VEPIAYLKDVLERMSNGHPMSRLDDLLPWNWTASNPLELGEDLISFDIGEEVTVRCYNGANCRAHPALPVP